MVNIADVARHAGVSRSTVSYVLSGKRQISAATQERVLESIGALGFEPNPAALALTTRKTGMVALAATITLDAPEVDAAALREFVMSTAYCLRSYGYDMVLLAQPTDMQMERLKRGLLADGLIVMNVLWRDIRLPVLASASIPVALMGAPEDPHGLVMTDLDYEAAGKLAVDHLAMLGHSHIGLISGPAGLNSVTRVERGALAAAAAMPDGRVDICAGENAFKWLTHAMEGPDGCTALVLHNQREEPRLLQALNESGTRVPEDLSVVAISTQVALGDNRDLTAIVVPVDAIVREAVRAIMAIIDGDEAVPRLLQPTLTVGRSSAAVKGLAENSSSLAGAIVPSAACR